MCLYIVTLSLSNTLIGAVESANYPRQDGARLSRLIAGLIVVVDRIAV